jgi:hypothetical protein
MIRGAFFAWIMNDLKTSAKHSKTKKNKGMVPKRHKISNVPLILKVCDVIFCMLGKQITGHLLGFLEEASTFLTPPRNHSKWPHFPFKLKILNEN